MRLLVAIAAVVVFGWLAGFGNDARIIYAHHTGQPIPADAIAGRSAARIGGQDPLGSMEHRCEAGPDGAELAGGMWAEPGEAINCRSLIPVPEAAG